MVVDNCQIAFCEVLIKFEFAVGEICLRNLEKSAFLNI